MLEPWIIEEIRRREEEERRHKEERLPAQIPEIDPEAEKRWEDEQKRQRQQEEKEKPKRGVTIIGPDGE